MWKAHGNGWARPKQFSINRFDIGQIWPVRKVGQTVSDDAIDLSLSFVLNTGVDGHIIEEAAGHGGRLRRCISEINRSKGTRGSQCQLPLISSIRRQLAVMGCE